MYLLYKVARSDFVYFVPGVKGFGKYVLAIILRVTTKILVDFTGMLIGRIPQELGGFCFSFSLIMSHASCWVIAAVYLAHHTGDDKIDASSIYLFIGGLQALWVVAVVLFLSKIKRKYLSAFYSIETSPQYIRAVFVDNTDAGAKMVILGVHTDHWLEIRDDVKAYSLEHWKRWEEEKPAWFNKKFKAKVPDDFIPKEALEKLKYHQDRRSKGGKRRSSSGKLLVEEEEKTGAEVGGKGDAAEELMPRRDAAAHHIGTSLAPE